MKDKLLNHKEAAEYLGITPGTLYNWVNTRRIEVVRLSRQALRYRVSQLEKMINDRTQIAVKPK